MRIVGWSPVEDPARERTRRREARARWWRRTALRHRRLAAALLLAVATALVVSALRPVPPTTARVLVAAADLPAGHRLGAGDLTELQVPPGVVPATALGPADIARVTGEVLAAPVGVGELVTTSRTVGAGLLTSAPPGTLAVPVGLGTPMPDGVLRAGDRVAVLAGGPADPYAQGLDGEPAGGGRGRGEVLVTAATVLLAPQRSAQDGGVLPAAGTGTAVALLALTTAEAEAVAGAGGRALTLAVLPPGGAGAN